MRVSGLRTALRRAADRAIWAIEDRMANRRPLAAVACNVVPTSAAWGGGNQWLLQMMRFLRRSGYSVRFDLRERVDCLLLASGKPGSAVAFDLASAHRYLRAHPECVCVQRINDSDAHRGSQNINGHLAEANALADHTVFLSEWLRDYHAGEWFDRSKPHSIIYNGADSRIFHPIGSETWRPGTPMRLVTHHWSSHPSKGFEVYAAVDELIATGGLPDTELWIIGSWPPGSRWRAARLVRPLRGRELAGLLRQCHVYLTASRWEAGGMHFLEGIQCGLPVLFHEDGGGIVEVGRRFGVGFRDDPAAAIAAMRVQYQQRRTAVLESPPSGEGMALQYRDLVQRLLVERRGG